MKYDDNKQNHVILPGRENALNEFLNSRYKGINHKLKNSYSSNSEDALTWSCFDILKHLPFNQKIIALDQILGHSFGEYRMKCNFSFVNSNYSENEIDIFVGRKYTGLKNEDTEVDASIETPDKIIFIEAKLYSSISLASFDDSKPHNQIVRKIRVGQQYAHNNKKEFYFIFLDIAPAKDILSFSNEIKSMHNALINTKAKWKSAWWFNYYKNGRNGSLKPLSTVLNGISYESVSLLANNMGWLTWADLYKIIMRSMVNVYYHQS